MKIRRVGFVLCMCAVAGLVWYWDSAQKTPSMAVNATQALATDNSTSEDEAFSQAVGLALKGIELVQGEKGFEHMRLKASWAAMRQDDKRIDIQKPVLRYTLDADKRADQDTNTNAQPQPPVKEKYIDVTADRGLITDNQKKITLEDNVVAAYEGYTLHSQLMQYDSATRRMFFPNNASIAGPKISGTAGQVLWNIPDGIIEAEKGVSMIWEGSPLRSKTRK